MSCPLPPCIESGCVTQPDSRSPRSSLLDLPPQIDSAQKNYPCASPNPTLVQRCRKYAPATLGRAVKIQVAPRSAPTPQDQFSQRETNFFAADFRLTVSATLTWTACRSYGGSAPRGSKPPDATFRGRVAATLEKSLFCSNCHDTVMTALRYGTLRHGTMRPVYYQCTGR